jgi:hypothetical protein
MDEKEVSRRRLKLKDDRKLLSPPWLAEPLYQCATAVTVYGFVAHAKLDVEVAGTVVIANQQVGFPEPQGATLALPAALVAGQSVRVRQKSGGMQSAWSSALTVRDHTQDYPAGPPRPQINPAPVYKCGSRTGVGNLLAGGNVWITADAVEVGRVNGCAPQQGVNVSPDYGLGESVRAWFELCADPSPPSKEEITQPPPAPLPTPGFDPIYEGGEQLRITNIVNGARVTLYRNGINQGTWGCWGGALLVGLNPAFSSGESFSATQSMCPGDPPSPPGGGTVQPCSSLPAPKVGPIQAGDTSVTVTQSAPGAVIKVYLNGVQVGAGSAPLVLLTQTVKLGDAVVITQDLPGCQGQTALQITVACVDPPTTSDPSALDLFPVGFMEYADGGTKGSVYYPAEDDGKGQPFNERVAKVGRVPIVVMAHGNHSPADPSYLGYDYFQAALAKMGMIAVSVDCNALNGSADGVQNIEDRADLIIDSIKYFQDRDADATSIFFGRIDFSRLGLVGHSRGGDAVVTVPTVIGLAGVTIKGVLALAPTNFRFWFGLPTIQPAGYAFMTILPAGDGDVVDNNGAQFYDQAGPAPFKSQLYVHYTNHNFFNRQWAFDDGSGPPVISRPDHERVLSVYGSAFFRSVLLGHSTERFLAGTQKPAGVLSDNVHLSFEWAKALTVDDHEDANTINTNSLGRPTSQSGGLTADEFSFGQVAGAFNTSFYGESVGMVAPPGGPSRTFRSDIKKRDLRKREVWIRAAEVFGGSIPAGATGFQLGLEDSTGSIAWVDCDLVGGLPRPYNRPSRVKSMLNTLRFKSDCFATVQPKLKLQSIVAILIRCNRRDKRALAFDDLRIVKP